MCGETKPAEGGTDGAGGPVVNLELRALTELELQALMVLAEAESHAFDRYDARQRQCGIEFGHYGDALPRSVLRLERELERRGVLS